MIQQRIASLAGDLLLFFSILTGLCFLCFFPSLEIVEIEFTRLEELPVDFTVPPGKLLVQNSPENSKNIQLNGTAVSRIDSQKYFFVAGLYGGRKKILHGELSTSRSPFDGVLTFPKRKYFKNYIRLKTEPLKSGNTLRLPASVRKKLKSGDEEKKRRDRNSLITALKTNNTEPSFACWKRPLKSKITSDFGRPRNLPSGRSYYHSGVDLRAFTHTPIAAANQGKVVFSGHMLVPGNNIILSHGHGLFSRYMHLESTSKKVGDTVKTGEIIGTAGATGRVEAPHLHWEVIWKGQHADPLQFVIDWEEICDNLKTQASL